MGSSPSSSSKPGPAVPASGNLPEGTGSSSSGKLNTSVGPFFPKNRSFKTAIASSSTKKSDASDASGTPCARNADVANATKRSSGISWSACSLAPNTSTVIRWIAFRTHSVVGIDNIAHNFVADHIFSIQVNKGNAINACQDVFDPNQS